MKKTYRFSAVVAVLVLGASLIAAQAGASDEGLVTGKAPDFTLTDVDGNEVSLSQFAGKIVVLEWTNYDCPFVKAHYNDQVHTMKGLSAKYADDGVVWLTINSTHYATTDSIKEWAETQDIQHQTLLVDSDGKVGKLYQAKTTPHLFVIDKDGMIVYQGAIDNAPRGSHPEVYENYVDQALTQLLAGNKITVPQTKPYGCSVKYPPGNKSSEG